MISAILLAAGQSKRMKGENKLSKEIQDIPLINHSVKNILTCVHIEELIVVLGYQKKIVEKIISKFFISYFYNKKIKFIFNKDFESGMSSSIKVGINHLSKKTEAFFICLGDMPEINENIYNQLIAEYLVNHVDNLLCKNSKEIIVPKYKGQQGNPVLFNESMREKIMSIAGDVGAKKILELNKDKVLNLEINDQSVTKDFNTQDDFSSL